ncbi:MAG: M42 family metallopeptidase [Chloroflexota bacterium]|nr:MAG: peptidase M42 [Chloroflexota bacterium]
MLLKELSQAIGVSGKEDAVRKLILEAIEPHVTDIQIDPLGSVTAVKAGTEPGRPRVMVAAHMDEVGFMVTGIDNDGLIRFTGVGGLDERILPGLRVKVGDNQLPGCIIWTPIHHNREQNVVKMKQLRIDIGATSKDAALNHVKPGDRIAFDSEYRELSDTVVRGKAFDDRVGCSLLVDVLAGGPYAVDVLAAFTVQEEIGLRGATVSAQRLNADVALVLEGTTAHDLPNPLANPDDDEPVNPTTRLGHGPALTIMDRSMIVPPRLLAFIRETAEANGIPYQFKTQLGGGTDGGSIHVAAGGRPTAVISMPCRYIHSPIALLNKDDYANTLRLVQAVLNGLTFDVLPASNGRV